MAYNANRARGSIRLEQVVPVYIPPAFDPSELENRINQKANASTVGGLRTALNSKASQADLDEIAAVLKDGDA